MRFEVRSVIAFIFICLCSSLALGATQAEAEKIDASSSESFVSYNYDPADELPTTQALPAYQWDENEKVVVFPISIRPGWLPIIAANHGFAANESSVFYQKYGFKLELSLIDDFVAARDEYVSGESPILAGTLDMIAHLAPRLMTNERTAPRIYQQISWSKGNDRVVSRSKIRTLRDLRHKIIACVPASPAQYFITNLLLTSGIRLDEVEFRHFPSLVEAVTAFINNPEIDACVGWAPDINKIPERIPATRFLASTSETNRVITDIWAVRTDFARDNPEIVKGLVAGIFEGMLMLEDAEFNARACQWMADGYGITVNELKTMLSDVRFSNFAENRDFFMNAINKANFEHYWKNINLIFGLCGCIDTPVDFKQVVDFTIIKELYGEAKFSTQNKVSYGEYVPLKYEVVSTEPLQIAQIARIHYLPNSYNVYEPRHDEFGSAIINTLNDPGAPAAINFIGKLAETNVHCRIHITGHADNSLGKEKARHLGRARANGVRQILVNSFGFGADRFVISSPGNSKPYQSDMPSAILDRRVEIWVEHPLPPKPQLKPKVAMETNREQEQEPKLEPNVVSDTEREPKLEPDTDTDADTDTDTEQEPAPDAQAEPEQ